ncbi:MAG: GNAT family N-acetyltransferase [Desulfosarcina sp.]|nr:GNAT family N-acetyltransferase [Desulfobacterales bacterium]
MHDILAVRQSVFVVEQNCAYQDADYLDHCAWHLTGRRHDGQIVAYLRVNAPGSHNVEPSIGRVLTVKTVRGGRLASNALRQALARCETAYPGHAIHIAAQVYLVDFYGRFGFKPVGLPYDEDGIAHIDMIRPAAAISDSI